MTTILNIDGAKDRTRVVNHTSSPGFTRTLQINPLTGAIVKDTTTRFMFTSRFAIETISSLEHKGPPYETGGPMRLKRYEVRRSSQGRSYLTPQYNSGGWAYRKQKETPVQWVTISEFLPAVISPATVQAGYNSVSFPVASLEMMGQRAFERFSPLNTKASLAQTLVELKREGLPKVPNIGDIRRLLKGINPRKPPSFRYSEVGAEYLNLVFGWRPLLSDMMAVTNAASSLDNKIKQLLRDNNRGVRRKGTISQSTVVTNESSRNVSQNLEPGLIDYVDPAVPLSETNGFVRVKEVVTERIWFSARYRYFLPLDSMPLGAWVRKAKRLQLGLDVSPSLLWEVMPWSWLIDWFFNVGDVIDRIDGDGYGRLTCDYAYIMRHVRKVRTATYWARSTIANVPSVPPWKREFPPTLFWEERISETKERNDASLFGFGQTTGSLTAGQKFVLAALGQQLYSRYT